MKYAIKTSSGLFGPYSTKAAAKRDIKKELRDRGIHVRARVVKIKKRKR